MLLIFNNESRKARPKRKTKPVADEWPPAITWALSRLHACRPQPSDLSVTFNNPPGEGLSVPHPATYPLRPEAFRDRPY